MVTLLGCKMADVVELVDSAEIYQKAKAIVCLSMEPIECAMEYMTLEPSHILTMNQKNPIINAVRLLNYAFSGDAGRLSSIYPVSFKDDSLQLGLPYFDRGAYAELCPMSRAMFLNVDFTYHDFTSIRISKNAIRQVKWRNEIYLDEQVMGFIQYAYIGVYKAYQNNSSNLSLEHKRERISAFARLFFKCSILQMMSWYGKNSDNFSCLYERRMRSAQDRLTAEAKALRSNRLLVSLPPNDTTLTRTGQNLLRTLERFLCATEICEELLSELSSRSEGGVNRSNITINAHPSDIALFSFWLHDRFYLDSPVMEVLQPCSYPLLHRNMPLVPEVAGVLNFGKAMRTPSLIEFRRIFLEACEDYIKEKQFYWFPHTPSSSLRRQKIFVIKYQQVGGTSNRVAPVVPRTRGVSSLSRQVQESPELFFRLDDRLIRRIIPEFRTGYQFLSRPVRQRILHFALYAATTPIKSPHKGRRRGVESSAELRQLLQYFSNLEPQIESDTEMAVLYMLSFLSLELDVKVNNLSQLEALNGEKFSIQFEQRRLNASVLTGRFAAFIYYAKFLRGLSNARAASSSRICNGILDIYGILFHGQERFFNITGKS